MGGGGGGLRGIDHNELPLHPFFPEASGIRPCFLSFGRDGPRTRVKRHRRRAALRNSSLVLETIFSSS